MATPRFFSSRGNPVPGRVGVTEMRLSGFTDLHDALGQLPVRLARATLVRVLKKAAKPIEDSAKALAPKGTPPFLATTIRTTTKKPPNRPDNAAFAAVLRSGGSKTEAVRALRDVRRRNPSAFAEIFVGPGKARAAIVQEFGFTQADGVFNLGKPYMRPAWDANKDTAFKIIAREMQIEVRKTVARLAKRQLKARIKARG